MKKLYLPFLLCILSMVFVATNTWSDEPNAGLMETPLAQKEPSNIPLNFESKSPAKAFLFSAIIPGTGEIYTGAKRGYVQIIAEVGFIAAAIITHRQASDMRDDYFTEVEKYVLCDDFLDDIPDKPCLFEKWTGEDYEHATMYDNWHNVYTESEGKPIERVGAFYWEDRKHVKDDEKRERDPDSEERDEALKLRNKSNDRFQLSKIFIGLTIFNHIVSAIDARIMAKIYNQRHKSEAQTLSFRMIIQPDNSIESQFVFRRRF